jgi:hypothetical protein
MWGRYVVGVSITFSNEYPSFCVVNVPPLEIRCSIDNEGLMNIYVFANAPSRVRPSNSIMG